jgi:hypothetical protein
MDGRAVEAFSFPPPGIWSFPGVLFDSGYQRTAVNLISLRMFGRLRRASVDPKRMGIYGYSRGGMAASLLVHGEKDVNVPVTQAYTLRDWLTEMHKNFEIRPLPDREHSIGPEVMPLTVDFFKRWLRD